MGTGIEATGTNAAGLTRHYRAITHNLANANTAGFKRQIGSMSQEDTGSATGEIQDHVSVDFGQGRLVQTGRPLDFAMDGKNSFFVVESPNGPLYTRNGVFRMNPQGQLVDAGGRTVAGQNGPITIPPSVGANGVTVAEDGSVSGGGQNLGRIRMVRFEDTTKLEPASGVSFKAPEGVEPVAADDAVVYQRFQEGSNVVAVEELVDLITLSRLYEANFKTIGSQDDRMKSIIQVAMG
jgi:flagellar basal-body rod protein FlgF